MQDFNKTKKILFEYFTQQEANLFVFYRIPKELFTNPKYKKLSAEAKILYGLLLDRNGLSLQNGWIDNEGHIYIYFSREEAMEMLSIGTEKVVKLFKELNEVSLIKEVRQGLNRPNIIYVGKFLASHVDVPTGFRKSKLRKFGNRKSRSSEIESQEVRKSKSNNTDINKTYRNKNEMSQSVVNLPAASPQLDPKQPTTDRLTSAPPHPITGDEPATLTAIYEQSQTAHSPAQDFVEHVIKKLYSDGNMPSILKMGLTHEEIRSRLHHLKPAHVERALTKSKHATNKELYFAKALLSAIVELALNDLPVDPPAPPPPRPQRQGLSQRDNFEQREYSDEELERFYVNLTE